MNSIAKIALVNSEIIITKYALEKILNESKSSLEKQTYARVILKIDKATKKHIQNQSIRKQIEIELG